MKNKILLINPAQSSGKNSKYTNFKFPLGLLYIAGKLETNGFDVKIIDAPLYYKKRKEINEDTIRIGLFKEDIKKIIKDFNPDIVGVSCAYSAYETDSFEVINTVRETEKELNKKFLIVTGGAHSSANTEQVLKNKEIDIVVLGEGEETMLEIAEKYNRKSLKKIKGTAFKENKKLIINKPREYIQNLDEVSAAWHLLDMNLYFKHPDNSVATLRNNSVDLVTSRGCPMNCRFCSIHTVWGRKWRGRSAKNVVDEMELLVKKYGAKQFRIQDDNMTLNKERILEICKEIKKRSLDIRWDTRNGVAFWTLDEEILKAMRKAGCYRITFGIESGCKNTQKYVRKIVDLEKIKNLINICHKHRLWVCSTFIIGFPYEIKKEIMTTKNFILNSKLNFPFIYVAQPYPGTDMHKDFQKENLIQKIKTTSNIKKSLYHTKHFTGEELNKIKSNIIREFYLKKILSYANPITFYKEFLSKHKKLEDFKYTFKNIYNIVSNS